MSSYDYGWEKLHCAVSALAGPGDLRDRLVDAVAGSLIHITPKRDLPEEIHDEFSSLMKSVTSVSPRVDEGAVQASVYNLDDLGLLRAAEAIIGFYDVVCRRMPKGLT